MPWCPHEYLVRDKSRRDSEFLDFIAAIREFGYDDTYMGKPRGKLFRYMDFEGMKYWTMGCALDVTVVLNRAEIEWVPRPIVRNPKPWVVLGWDGDDDPAQVAHYRRVRGMKP